MDHLVGKFSRVDELDLSEFVDDLVGVADLAKRLDDAPVEQLPVFPVLRDD